jgi:hypothetical protein
MFTIDLKELISLDKYFDSALSSALEEEVESVTKALWDGVESYGTVHLFFIHYLNVNLLRTLNIYYFSIVNLKKKHKEIKITDSLTILDIIAKFEQVDVQRSRHNHDAAFHLSKRIIKNRKGVSKFKVIIYRFLNLVRPFFSKDIKVIFLNAGKLNKDFRRLDSSFNAKAIKIVQTEKNNLLAQKIIQKSKENILELNLSFPNQLLVDVLDAYVYNDVHYLLDSIDSYVDFINKHNVRVVIASAPMHEEHIALLSAASLTEAKSLVIGHGFSLNGNPAIDNYIDYSANISDLEYKHKAKKIFKLKMDWFNESKI